MELIEQKDAEWVDQSVQALRRGDLKHHLREVPLDNSREGGLTTQLHANSNLTVKFMKYAQSEPVETWKGSAVPYTEDIRYLGACLINFNVITYEVE